jgi:hypothetical protein
VADPRTRVIVIFSASSSYYQVQLLYAVVYNCTIHCFVGCQEERWDFKKDTFVAVRVPVSQQGRWWWWAHNFTI